MEALQQRLDKYQSATDQAKKEGNSSKARRMGRIVKVRRIIGICKILQKNNLYYKQNRKLNAWGFLYIELSL